MTVYLLHADEPYIPEGCEDDPRKWMRHYLGDCADGELDRRVAQHRAGAAAGGARVPDVWNRAGIGWRVARTWEGGPARAEQLKEMGSARRRCPACGVRPRADARPRPEGTMPPAWAVDRIRRKRIRRLARLAELQPA